jgi:hypothetical protein
MELNAACGIKEEERGHCWILHAAGKSISLLLVALCGPATFRIENEPVSSYMQYSSLFRSETLKLMLLA